MMAARRGFSERCDKYTTYTHARESCRRRGQENSRSSGSRRCTREPLSFCPFRATHFWSFHLSLLLHVSVLAKNALCGCAGYKQFISLLESLVATKVSKAGSQQKLDFVACCCHLLRRLKKSLYVVKG